MMKPQLYNFLLTAVLVFSFPAFVAARNEGSTIVGQSVRENIKTHRDATKQALDDYQTKRSATASDRLNALIVFGDRATNQRLKALEEMENRLASGKCSAIGASTKASMTGQINSMRATINSQKGLIDKSVSLDEARKNVKAVFEKNRVFIHYIPALSGVCASQRVIDLVDGKLASAVALLKDAGRDTTTLEVEVNKAKSAATAAKELYEQVIADPSAASAHATIDAAAVKLKEAKVALEAAHVILKANRDAF